MKISVDEFKQLLASHQEDLRVEGQRIEILRESLLDACKSEARAKVQEKCAQEDLRSALGDVGSLADRCSHLEGRLFATSRELYDLQNGLDTPHLREEQVRAFIRNTAGNQKIASIKLIRETLGLSLKPAKDLFEAEYAKGQNLVKPWTPTIGDMIKSKLEEKSDSPPSSHGPQSNF
jgi:hypothetical protein